MTQPPREIRLHKASRTLELTFPDGSRGTLSAELLRVMSPSAEVRGHSPDDKRLQTGKKYVNIENLEPVGNYAVRIRFDDGHDSGIYAWDFLKDLMLNQENYWQEYLQGLKAANASRLPRIL